MTDSSKPKKKKKSSEAKKASSKELPPQQPHLNHDVLKHLTPFDLLQVARTEKAARARIFDRDADKPLWRTMCVAEFRFVMLVDRRGICADVPDDDDVLSALSALRKRQPTVTESWLATYRFIASRAFLDSSECSFFTSAYLRPDVEAELMVRVPGTYCVRPSSGAGSDCVLSANSDGRVQHHLVVSFGGTRGCMLLDRHYRSLAAMLIGQDAVKLEQPLSRSPKLQDAMARVAERVKASVNEAKLSSKTAYVPKDVDVLHEACRWGLVAEAVELIESGVDLTLRNARGETPLHCCVSTVLRCDTLELIELLIQRGADINALDDSGMTPLLTAVCQPMPHMEAVQTLVRFKPKAKLSVLRKGLPAPLIAVARGVRPLVDIFLSAKGAPLLSSRGSVGEGALHVAARFGRKDLIDLLLATPGVSIDATDARGRTPLHYAVADARDSWINTFMWGPPVRAHPPFAICQHLITTHHAAIDCKDLDGKTPLWFAAFNGQRSATRALFELGASGVAAARAAGVAGRSAPRLLHEIEQMHYFVFIGMRAQMAAFLATIDEQFAAIQQTLASERPAITGNAGVSFVSLARGGGDGAAGANDVLRNPLVRALSLSRGQIVPFLTCCGFPLFVFPGRRR